MGAPRLRIDLGEQRAYLLEDGRERAVYPVSTGRNGIGERMDSGCTPRGLHRVHAKFGAGLPLDTVFVGRRPTGERYTPELARRHPERDWILARILWLDGLEPGRNRGGDHDSRARYIYIHGCPDDAPMGVPGSGGCIRMRSAQLAELFERLAVDDRVLIEEGTPR